MAVLRAADVLSIVNTINPPTTTGPFVRPPQPGTASPPDAADLFDAELDFARAQLEAVREQLTESQRLATIGTIAAVIAHEFNNLLTPMVSYSQFALQSAAGDRPDMDLIRKALRSSYTASTKAGRICNSMLGLARGEAGSFGPVPVQGLVDEVLNVLARDPVKDGIELLVRVEPNLTVWGDRIQLEQVLLNLLINARQAMLGRGGSLRVEAVAAFHDGAPGVHLEVADTGPGIPDRHLAKIFTPFFTTKGTAVSDEPRGTGLGLSICKEIVRAPPRPDRRAVGRRAGHDVRHPPAERAAARHGRGLVAAVVGDWRSAVAYQHSLQVDDVEPPVELVPGLADPADAGEAQPLVQLQLPACSPETRATTVWWPSAAARSSRSASTARPTPRRWWQWST